MTIPKVSAPAVPPRPPHEPNVSHEPSAPGKPSTPGKPPVDNNKANKDGSGIDTSAPPPSQKDNPDLYQAYQDKKTAEAQLTAQQRDQVDLLNSTLAQIKAWAVDGAKTSEEI